MLLHKSGRFFLTEKNVFNTEFGLVNVREGKVISSKGEEFTVTRPFFHDLWTKIRRGPQITHWKDLGFIVSITGVGSGWKIIEAGSGSGFSTCFFANIVGETGHVFSYEVNPKFLRLARENVKWCGMERRVTFKLKDVYTGGFEEEDVDLVFLDLPEPWRCFEHAWNALKPAGYLVCYLPTIEQVVKCLHQKFTVPEVYEVLHREWKVSPTRPKNTGLTHTAFIVKMRKMEG